MHRPRVPNDWDASPSLTTIWKPGLRLTGLHINILSWTLLDPRRKNVFPKL